MYKETTLDVITISDAIQDKIKLLEKMRKELRVRAENKANTSAEYEKAIAITLIGLKNSKQYLIDGEAIQNPPASIMDKLARGICYKEKLEMEKADGLYKSLISNMHCVQAELNGWQSINRHLSEA